MNIFTEWNKNRFSIYNRDEKTVLKLIEELCKYVNMGFTGINLEISSTHYNIILKKSLVINNDWSEVIQFCLDNYKKIYIPMGEYDIYKEIELQDGCEIVFGTGAIINKKHEKGKMFVTKYDLNTQKYDGAKNIKIIGGTLNPGSVEVNGSVITLFHAQNIIIDNLRILDTQGSHSIDIVGCSSVIINNCTFEGYKVDTQAYFREAIQIDTCMSVATGFDKEQVPVKSPCYDGTRCKNIFITNNKFIESEKNPPPLNAIGTHTQYNDENKSENIYIVNNYIKGNGSINDYGNGIRCEQMKNVFIVNNVIENVQRGIIIDNADYEYNTMGEKIDSTHGFNQNIQIYSNTISTCEGSAKNIRPIEINCNNTLILSDRVVNHKNIIISNNILTNKSDNNSIRIETCDNTVIKDNFIIGGSGAVIIYTTNCNNVTTGDNKNIQNSGNKFEGGKINGCGDYLDVLNKNITITSTDDEYRCFQLERNNEDGKKYRARYGIGKPDFINHPCPSIELYDVDNDTVLNRIYVTEDSFVPSRETTSNLGTSKYKWNEIHGKKYIIVSPNKTEYILKVNDNGEVSAEKNM